MINKKDKQVIVGIGYLIANNLYLKNNSAATVTAIIENFKSIHIINDFIIKSIELDSYLYDAINHLCILIRLRPKAPLVELSIDRVTSKPTLSNSEFTYKISYKTLD